MELKRHEGGAHNRENQKSKIKVVKLAFEQAI